MSIQHRSPTNNKKASSLKLSSEHDSCSQDEPQQTAKAPLSPSKPSLPITPGSLLSSSFKRTSTSRGSGGKSKKSPKKKSVRFNQAVTARPSLHKNNYTQKETAATWYSQKEFEGIRKDVLKTLTLIRSGKLVEPEDVVVIEESFGDDASTVATETSSRSSQQQQQQQQQRTMRRSSGSYRGLSSKGTTSIYRSAESRQRTPEAVISTARGLENYTPKGSIKSSVRRLRQNAVWAVMEEQDLQVDRAEALEMSYLWYDDEAIRDVYRKHSKPAQRNARLLGVADASPGGDPAAMPTRSPATPRRRLSTSGRRQSLTSLTGRRHSANAVGKNTFRKLFSPKPSEDTLIKKAALAFSSSSSSSNDKSSPTRTTTSSSTKQRRWSLLSVGSNRRGSLSAEGPKSPAALVA